MRQGRDSGQALTFFPGVQDKQKGPRRQVSKRGHPPSMALGKMVGVGQAGTSWYTHVHWGGAGASFLAREAFAN